MHRFFSAIPLAFFASACGSHHQTEIERFICAYSFSETDAVTLTSIEYTRLSGNVAIESTKSPKDPNQVSTSQKDSFVASDERKQSTDKILKNIPLSSLLPLYDRPVPASGSDGTAVTFNFFNQDISKKVIVDSLDPNTVPASLLELYNKCLKQDFK